MTSARKNVNGKLVAVLNYRTSKGILNVADLLARAGKKGKVIPGDWQNSSGEFRSLAVYDDGSCLLQTLSAGSMIRRIERTGR